MFLDRNTGIVLDHDFKYDKSDTIQKVYSIHGSLKKAIEYAENRKTITEHGNNNIGYCIYDKNENIVLHTDNLTKNNSLTIKTLVINGDKFSDTEGFYNEIDKVLTSELNWKTGHNLNALNDILWGGFGVHEYEESIYLVWNNSAKSKMVLSDLLENKTLYQTIIEIIRDHAHIVFSEN
ncbi:MAG: barstar family protein [Bacteroidetes bacterium]|nr:barstar family protein [Bacteroidota bacterium]